MSEIKREGLSKIFNDSFFSLCGGELAVDLYGWIDDTNMGNNIFIRMDKHCSIENAFSVKISGNNSMMSTWLGARENEDEDVTLLIDDGFSYSLTLPPVAKFCIIFSKSGFGILA